MKPVAKRFSAVFVAIISPPPRLLGHRQPPAPLERLVAERETEEAAQDRSLVTGETQQTAEHDDRRTGQGG